MVLSSTITAAAIVGSLAIAAPASAAPIRECGQRGAANGYQTITNITSRNVPCSSARYDAYVIYRELGPNDRGYARCPRNCVAHWRGWRITIHHFRWVWDGAGVGWLYAADVRSTASRGRVLHFQAYGE